MPDAIPGAIIGLGGAAIGALVALLVAMLNTYVTSLVKSAELRQQHYEVWAVRRFDVHARLMGELESAVEDTQSGASSWVELEHRRWSRRVRLTLAELRLLSSDEVAHLADVAICTMELAMHLNLGRDDQVDQEAGQVLRDAREDRDAYVRAAREEAKSGPTTAARR